MPRKRATVVVEEGEAGGRRAPRTAPRDVWTTGLSVLGCMIDVEVVISVVESRSVVQLGLRHRNRRSDQRCSAAPPLAAINTGQTPQLHLIYTHSTTLDNGQLENQLEQVFVYRTRHRRHVAAVARRMRHILHRRHRRLVLILVRQVDGCAVAHALREDARLDRL